MDILLVDSSGVLAAIDAGESQHESVRAVLAEDRRPLVVTDFVIAEVDYMLLTRLGHEAEQAFIDQVREGIFVREPITDEDLRHAQEIANRYAEHGLGITDASLMALSERRGARRILTLDRRHFSVFRDRKGRALEIVP